MSGESSDLVELYRQFVDASGQLLAASGEESLRTAVETFLTTLEHIPGELYDRDEVAARIDSILASERLAASGDVWLDVSAGIARRDVQHGSERTLSRALETTERVGSGVDPHGAPGWWAYFKLIAGDAAGRARFLDNGNELAIAHYRSALEVVRREDRPELWAAIMTGLGHALAGQVGGDRANLERTLNVFSQLADHWSSIGSVERLADTQLVIAETLVENAGGPGDVGEADENRTRAIGYFDKALSTFRQAGDTRRAQHAAGRLAALAPPVLFTAYYPRVIVSDRTYSFVVYAHRAELQAAVQQDVGKFADELGGHVPTPRQTRESVKLAPGTPVTIVPESDACTFEPPRQTKVWGGDWTRFLFDVRAGAGLAGEVVVANISIQVNGIEVASIRNCAFDIVAADKSAPAANPLAASLAGSQTAGLYQRIFVSYSRLDPK